MGSDTSSFLFAEKSVGKLLARFALPAIFAQLANSVYLIVDQVLLANSNVGVIGYGATSVAFPILTAANAFAFLFGGGGASFAALRLGEGKADAGRQALLWSTIALLGNSVLVTVLGLCFLRPILVFFGATDALLPYASAYARILWMGLPLIALASALSYWVRADGSPGVSMAVMLTGAVLNIGFDWLFLFPLGWGIAGVAWAMVLSRGLSALLGIWYLWKRAKHFSLSVGGHPGECLGKQLGEKDSGWKTLRDVAALGSSGFLMQCAIVVVQIVTNRSLGHAATQASLDPSVAIGAMGVVTKVNGILIALVTGLAAGAQPILGYHKGAGHEKEVRTTYWLSVLWASFAAVVCWGITVFGARWVAALFAGGFSGSASAGASADASPGNGVDMTFLSTTVWFLRTYLLAIFTAGFQLISSYYFQATGRPWKACLLTLSRQLFLLVPLIFILSRIFGLQGILYAGPLADVGAAVVAGIFVWKEWRGNLRDLPPRMRRMRFFSKTHELKPN